MLDRLYWSDDHLSQKEDDMRQYVIAGNWKMHKDVNETEALLKEILQSLEHPVKHTRVVVCPPFTSLGVAARMLKGSDVALGAQNFHPASSGAFTGEISGSMLKSVGCEYVIVGHSERRQLFGESNEFINQKVRAALSGELIPILCVGETLEERDRGVTNDIVTQQVRECLSEVEPRDIIRTIIAYEPVWAIGTGKTATPGQAQEIHLLIRQLLTELFGKETGEAVVIQYGGSVKPENAKELLAQPDIDGALVGGACLKSDSFANIIASVPHNH